MICACTHIMECLICRWFLTVEKLDLNFLPGATNAKIVVLNSQSPCQDKGISRLSWCARVPQELMLWHEQKIFLSSYQGILCKPLFAVTLLCSFCLFSIYSSLLLFPRLAHWKYGWWTVEGDRERDKNAAALILRNWQHIYHFHIAHVYGDSLQHFDFKSSHQEWKANAVLFLLLNCVCSFVQR